MYSNPVQALRAAYSAMATDTTVTTQVWNDMLGGIVKESSEGLSKFDRITQGVFTINLARKSARMYNRYMLEAVYLPPVTEYKVKKELSCKLISFRVYEELQKRIDRWFINDVTRSYSGLKPHHTDQWWAEHLHKTDRTIRRHKQKVMPVLDGLHDSLISDVENAFIEHGLISSNLQKL